MANLSASYDKAVLVISLVIALALGALVFMAKGKVDDDFPANTGSRSDKAPENPNEDIYQKITGKVGSEIDKAFLKGPVTDTEREMNLFVGTALFLDAEGREIDLGDPSYPKVHEPIENQWWLNHRIEPGWSNSPGLDKDGDGFSNREEFDGNTDPNDPRSFPAVIAKLQCLELKKREFMLTYSSDSTIGEIKESDTFKFNHEEIVNRRKVRTSSENIEQGKGNDSNLFSKGGAQMRYELTKVEQRKFVNPRNNLQETSNFAMIEDVAGAKKGDVIEIKKGSRNGVIIKDWTAVLVLAAIGEQGNQLEIKERDSFTLPFDPNAEEKPYTCAGVSDLGAAIIEWEQDGESKTLELQPLSPAK